MKDHKRGICLIINNIKFENLPERHGAQIDEEMLKDLFGNELSFVVEIKKNLCRKKITEVVDDFSTLNHQQFDAFVCIIMSHGNHQESIFCTKGKKVRVEDIMVEFNGKNCPSLLNKPKLFFIQACRGSPVVFSDEHQPDSSFPDFDSTLARGLYPHEADFLLAFSTAPGYLSRRDPSTGTRFIQVMYSKIS